MIKYRDEAIFYEIVSTGYANSKRTTDSGVVESVFLQNTGFLHGANQDAVNSDAVLYPKPENEFVAGNANRLEGMMVKVKMYGSSSDESWYKVISVAVNRDHLLDNKIDNIECLLKKSRPVDMEGTS